MLAISAVARLALAFVPSMWLWGLNVQRFLATAAAWAPWAAAALALHPAVARALLPALARAGNALARPRGVVVAALLAAILVLALPDRVRFVGDFLLRQGTVEQAGRPAVLFPQALPLDVLLHYTLPRTLVDMHLLAANGAARALGALEAALLAALAVAFARGLAMRDAAALATAAVVFFGGTLTMFTGLGKAFTEMVLLVAALGVFGLRVLRERRGLLPLAATLAAGLALHRSALGLVPAAALAFAWGARPHAAEGEAVLRHPKAEWLTAVSIAVLALAVMLPRIVATILRWDPIHLTPPEVREQGVVRAAFAGTRPADLLSLVTALSPLALAIPPVAILLGRIPGRGRELALLSALAVPFVLSMPLLHPAQGLFRDWDDFAGAGEALSLVAAWLVAETLRAAPGRAWLASGVTLAATTAALQWLAHFTDIERGLTRVEAFMSEPPRRTDVERGKTWDYLGIRNFRLERWDAAARAFARAAETSPSPRILLEWGTAELRRGDFRAAQPLFRRVIAANPKDVHAWSGLAAAAMALDQRDEARRAAEEVLRLSPGDAFARRTLERLGAP
ncbi:MAG TPA: tetratricopeptide repeat protein [Candidatus Eisenbacteria bacterium]